MTARGSDDERHMRRALQLALRGQGRVEPNPMVGCVIVHAGRVIGEGYHRRFGAAHAEIDALQRCTSSPRDATVYVTLEPCCHHGKTPPCTDALIAAGVARVVAPLADPNPDVQDKGFAQLRAAGIEVTVGVCASAARAVNAPFAKLVTRRRPWVILKWAQSLDGKIATHTGDSKWISDETCRAHAHKTRGRMDAIIVGVGTVLRDDPALTCRIERPRRVATRIVLDTRLRTPPTCSLVQTAREVPTWIFCGQRVQQRRVRPLEAAGCVIQRVPTTRWGLSLPAVLAQLGRREMTNVLVEGGGRVLGRFFDQKLADEFHVYVAPLLIGGENATGPLDAQGAATVANAWHLPTGTKPRALGNGQFISARV